MNPQGLIDFVIKNMPRGVGVPMVFQSKIDILQWNVKVLHYEDSIFIFADKFLSHSGAILLFHSDDLQIFKHIRQFLDIYSMSIRMIWVVVNSLPLCSTWDLELKVHLLSHIFSLLFLFLVFYSNPQCPFLFLQTLLSCTTLLVKTPQNFWISSICF